MSKKTFDWRKAVEEEINKPSETPEQEVNEQIALDDTQRIKVLSPGRLVFKRFIRSKLAITGSIILILMFVFCFLGAAFTPYKESDVFHVYKYQNADYGVAQEKIDYDKYTIEGAVINDTVNAYLTSKANEMIANNLTSIEITDPSGEGLYVLYKLGDNIFELRKSAKNQIVSYSASGGTFTFSLPEYDTPEFRTAVESLTSTTKSFTLGGQTFLVNYASKQFTIYIMSEYQPVMLATKYVFHNYDTANVLTDDYKIQVLSAIYDTGVFTYGGKNYIITPDDEAFIIKQQIDGEYQDYNMLMTFSAQRSTGEDSLSIGYKLNLLDLIATMESQHLTNLEFTFGDETFNLYRADLSFRIQQVQELYLIDIFAPPSGDHPLGTDGNGMDVLTRIMYGGRISLMIGFIVVFFEVCIGVVLGGIAGYFGGWIDNLLMRLVDLFNCLPFFPILIMLGAVFDKLNVDSYMRLVYLMIAMGVMGWPGVARLVRGQILSLREQEFMLAAEASGLSTGRKIFKHLVPNVMPQLIVNATMSLGYVILSESTLSFLGLGAKYPIATWGQIINGVKDSYALLHYTYIWIPVGLLICLTVIAFNFVGDGLRDAFDPKMKR